VRNSHNYIPITRGNPRSLSGENFYESIADVRCNDAANDAGHFPRAEANARLISAAPDLLKACESAFEVLHYLPGALNENEAAKDAYTACMKAVGKAKGHPTGDDVETEPRGVDGLTGAGEEVAELRDENERLKERVAELEEALADADQVIGVLKGAAAFLNAEGEKKGMPVAGNYRFWSKQCEEKKEMLEAAPLPDTDASQSVSREAEVSQ
jgi:hypothetical protein